MNRTCESVNRKTSIIFPSSYLGTKNMEMNPDSKSVMIDKKVSENNEDERVKRERDEKEVEQDKEQEGEVCDEAATETSLTGVDFKKMLSEIRKFKDHFTIKGFLLGLVLGLIPSGWDTFSDFAFAADDHNGQLN